ncbi:MAG TPA: Rid family detoxifying hydrolase [Desulfatiglandales bacterium]|nr:Rid family detoxifying hydrolase [Desulfatiglandales bacterium]
MREIFSPNAPKPAGHYSQAVIHDNIIYVSGQLPIDPATGQKRLGSIEEQTEQVLKNLAEIIKAAGSDINKVIKTTVYISDIQLWDRVNEVYGKFFGEHRPARAVVPIKNLHFGFDIEIEAIASLPQ